MFSLAGVMGAHVVSAESNFQLPFQQALSIGNVAGELGSHTVVTAAGSHVKLATIPLNARGTATVGQVRHCVPAPMLETQDATLWESFEGWDNANPNWIPEGWSKIVSNNDLLEINGNSTWHVVGKQLFSLVPLDGKCHAVINYATEKDDEGNPTKALPQDEWLITPQFTPKAGERFLFNVGMSPFYLFKTSGFDWETKKFKNREVSATLKLCVRVDGGEWTEVWDAYKIYNAMTDEEIVRDYLDVQYLHYGIDLTPYVGKKIEMGFRYVGIDGNIMAIDLVRVGTPKPQASYVRPVASFYAGFNDKFETMAPNGEGLILVPSYTNQCWDNRSSIDAETFKWSYTQPDGSMASASTRNLMLNYPVDYSKESNRYAVPQLEASATGVPADVYSWPGKYFQVGGNTKGFGVGTYDLNNGFFAMQGSGNKPIFGHFDGIDDEWTKLWKGKASLKSICNLFAAPEHSYALSKVSVMGVGELAVDAELTLDIYKVDSDGQFGNRISTATCKGSDAIYTTVEGVKQFSLPFHLNAMDVDGDEVLGLDTLTIETSIFMTLSGFNQEGAGDFGFFQSGADPNRETCGYFILKTTDEDDSEDEQVIALDALKTAKGNCYSSFLFGLDANYSWIETTDSDLTRKRTELYEDMYINAVYVDVPREGGKFQYHLVSSANPDEWKLEMKPYDDNEYADPEADTPDWLSVEVSGTKAATLVDVNVENNVSDEDRSAYYYASIPGARFLYIFTQRATTGVDQLSVATTPTVVCNGSDLLIDATSGVNFVNVFNALGMKVASASLQQGLATRIPVGEWAGGVYVLSFDNGTTARVIK